MKDKRTNCRLGILGGNPEKMGPGEAAFDITRVLEFWGLDGTAGATRNVTVLETEVKVSVPLVPLGARSDSLCQASALASGGFLATFSIPYFIETSPNLCLHVHMAFSLGTHLLVQFPLLRTPVILD